MASGKKKGESKNKNINLSPKLKKKLIRIALCAAFVLVAFIRASVTSPPEAKVKEPEKKKSSSFSYDFEAAEKQDPHGIGAWIADTIQGKNDKVALWDILFYKPEKSNTEDTESNTGDTSPSLNPDDYSGTSVSYSSDTEDLGKFTYIGEPYTVIDDNKPSFSQDEYTTESYAIYSPFDELGRCGQAHACLGKDLMPDSNRESINSVKPSGWINKKYDSSLVEGSYIYNRCHLIAFCLTGENANKFNLITGTRYFNVQGMLPFETEVANYIRDTNHHVLYRVTPIYDGNNLVASGVQMEAQSVEDNTISFNVFVFNVQPGIEIDYATGNTNLASQGEEAVLN